MPLCYKFARVIGPDCLPLGISALHVSRKEASTYSPDMASSLRSRSKVWRDALIESTVSCLRESPSELLDAQQVIRADFLDSLRLLTYRSTVGSLRHLTGGQSDVSPPPVDAEEIRTRSGGCSLHDSNWNELASTIEEDLHPTMAERDVGAEIMAEIDKLVVLFERVMPQEARLKAILGEGSFPEVHMQSYGDYKRRSDLWLYTTADLEDLTEVEATLFKALVFRVACQAVSGKLFRYETWLGEQQDLDATAEFMGGLRDLSRNPPSAGHRESCELPAEGKERLDEALRRLRDFHQKLVVNPLLCQQFGLDLGAAWQNKIRVHALFPTAKQRGSAPMTFTEDTFGETFLSEADASL